MNHLATSKEALLEASLHIAATAGLSSLNMRAIAKECGVSVGCVYGYFPSKAELLSATVEKIWEQIFSGAGDVQTDGDFRGCVRRIFRCIQSGGAAYPAFFSQHRAGFAEAEKEEGRRAMQQYLGHVRAMLLAALQNDPAVRQTVFSAQFSPEEFSGFVLENLLNLGTRREPSCEFLLQLIERLLY